MSMDEKYYHSLKAAILRLSDLFVNGLFLVPVKGGNSVWHSPSPNWQEKCNLYIYIAFWGVIYYRSHLLREPETTIDFGVVM